MRAVSPPKGLFAGRNFMTPDVTGYYKLRFGLGYAELSEGTGLNHNPIWGVTVRPDPENNKSKLFHSQRGALDYIEELS